MSKLGDLKHELIAKNKINNKQKSQVVLLKRSFIEDNPICNKCGTDKNISYDHIIPETILISFNIDPLREFWEENSQSLCVACNQRKANYLDFTIPKTKILLKQLLGV